MYSIKFNALTTSASPLPRGGGVVAIIRPLRSPPPTPAAPPFPAPGPPGPRPARAALGSVGHDMAAGASGCKCDDGADDSASPIKQHQGPETETFFR